MNSEKEDLAKEIGCMSRLLIQFSSKAGANRMTMLGRDTRSPSQNKPSHEMCLIQATLSAHKGQYEPVN